MKRAAGLHDSVLRPTLPALPLTANGKLDRRALPDVFRPIGMIVPASELPAPGTEQLLANIWREILRVEKINAGDNFFDLGGDSLLAIRVAVALQGQIGWRMDPRSLFFKRCGSSRPRPMLR